MNFFSIVFGRFISRLIGLNVRYLFFKLLGRKVAYADLKTLVINKENDYDEKGLQQDMYNALVGVLVILIIVAVLFFVGV